MELENDWEIRPHYRLKTVHVIVSSAALSFQLFSFILRLGEKSKLLDRAEKKKTPVLGIFLNVRSK